MKENVVQTQKFCTVINKNEIMISARKWIQLEVIMLNEIG